MPHLLHSSCSSEVNEIHCTCTYIYNLNIYKLYIVHEYTKWLVVRFSNLKHNIILFIKIHSVFKINVDLGLALNKSQCVCISFLRIYRFGLTAVQLFLSSNVINLSPILPPTL